MGEIIYYCLGCGESHSSKDDFYTSYNPSNTNGTYPFCKDYIKKTVYRDDGTIDVERFKDILRRADAPFLIEEMDKAIHEDKREPVGAYFSRINMQQNRHFNWNNSDGGRATKLEQKGLTVNEYREQLESSGFSVTPEMRMRWGTRYSDEQIANLEKFYIDMHMTHSIVVPQHEKALIMICKLQQKMDEALEEGDTGTFSKLHGEYQKLLTSSGLRPIDKVGGDEATGMRSFSQIYEEVERDGYIKPAPIKENQDIVDRSIQYIMNYTLRLLNKQVLTEPPVDTPKVDDR